MVNAKLEALKYMVERGCYKAREIKYYLKEDDTFAKEIHEEAMAYYQVIKDVLEEIIIP